MRLLNFSDKEEAASFLEKLRAERSRLKEKGATRQELGFLNILIDDTIDFIAKSV